VQESSQDEEYASGKVTCRQHGGHLSIRCLSWSSGRGLDPLGFDQQGSIQDVTKEVGTTQASGEAVGTGFPKWVGDAFHQRVVGWCVGQLAPKFQQGHAAGDGRV
jgi:hypothetical protein